MTNYKISKSMMLTETIRLLSRYLDGPKAYRDYPTLSFNEIKVKCIETEFNFDLSLDDFSELYLDGIAKVLAFKIKAVHPWPLFVPRNLDEAVADKASYNGITLYLTKDYKFLAYVV